MALKDRTRPLTTPQDVDAFLRENPLTALFKVGACHKTPEAYRAIAPALESREDIPLGILHVIECRPASNHVAALSGIVHESPQIILFRDGRAVFDRDNWDITPEAMAEGLEALQQVLAGAD